MRPRGIHSHLFQVLLVCVLPLGAFAAALLYFHWRAQEEQREHAQIESARLLAAAVDNALDGTARRLEIFARLWASRPASDEALYEQARAALGVNPDWENIVAFRADGRVLVEAENDQRSSGDCTGHAEMNAIRLAARLGPRALAGATIYASAPVAALADTDHAADLVDYRRFGASATYCSFYEDCWQLPAR